MHGVALPSYPGITRAELIVARGQEYCYTPACAHCELLDSNSLVVVVWYNMQCYEIIFVPSLLYKLGLNLLSLVTPAERDFLLCHFFFRFGNLKATPSPGGKNS
jgi:hypothetical protein